MRTTANWCPNHAQGKPKGTDGRFFQRIGTELGMKGWTFLPQRRRGAKAWVLDKWGYFLSGLGRLRRRMKETIAIRNATHAGGRLQIVIKSTAEITPVNSAGSALPVFSKMSNARIMLMTVPLIARSVRITPMVSEMDIILFQKALLRSCSALRPAGSRSSCEGIINGSNYILYGAASTLHLCIVTGTPNQPLSPVRPLAMVTRFAAGSACIQFSSPRKMRTCRRSSVTARSPGSSES